MQCGRLQKVHNGCLPAIKATSNSEQPTAPEERDACILSCNEQCCVFIILLVVAYFITVRSVHVLCRVSGAGSQATATRSPFTSTVPGLQQVLFCGDWT